MSDVAIIGLDLAKRVFQLHGSKADRSVAFRLKLPRARVLDFLASQQRCVVAMEACASAHGWGREIAKLGHSVRLIPPIYVKPFVKRQKNDATDAEAIAEAASRPTMRFVTAVPHPGPSRAPANPPDQCAARPSRRTWCRCADGGGVSQSPGRSDQRRQGSPAETRS